VPAQVSWLSSSLWLKKDQVIEISPPEDSSRLRLLLEDSETGESKPWQTSHLPLDSNGTIYFRVPYDIERSKVCFEWSTYDPLPYSFYTGNSNFASRASDPTERNNKLARAFYLETSVDETETNDDDVQESDIWKILGHKLYFFNQRRGLQILDLKNPLKPEVVARYRLPASGEQMYISESGKYIFLFATRPHQTWPYVTDLRVLKFESEQVTEVSSLSLPGNYQESRLIGDTLHILSEKWENKSTEWQGWKFNYSTFLTSLELDDPENLTKLNEIMIPGRPQVIQATNDHLALVTRDPVDYYNKHVTRIFSLNNPNNIPEEIALVRPGGRILDKFKIRISGNTLTLISQAFRNSNWNQRYSLLENFDMTTGEVIGSIDLAERETLYATRFEGNNAYIVTFLQTDPLFIIDLKVPAKPTIVSELIVPGWSEYLQIINNQLFAVGVENSRVTASLFDTSDKKNPFLKERIYMGDENDFSWSEANYDEKAIGQVLSQGLFFIPYQTWTQGTQENKLQLLKLESGSLEKGGKISHRVEARRSTTDSTGIYLFSISEEELIVSNILDIDAPYKVGSFPLAWTTNRTHIVGDNAVQLEKSASNQWGWGFLNNEQNATLRLTSGDEFDDLVEEINLGSGRLAGSIVDGSLVHLAIVQDNKFIAKTVEIEDEKIVPLGSTEIKLHTSSTHAEFKGFLVDKNFVCWATKAESNDFFYPFERNSLRIASDGYFPYQNNFSSKLEVHVFSYETGLASNSIVHESNVSINISQTTELEGPFRVGKKIIYGTTAYIDHYRDSGIIAAETNSTILLVDLEDPKSAEVQKPISSPGTLIGTQTNTQDPETGYLFFENSAVQLGNYNPESLSKNNVSTLEAFGRSLTSCAFDGSNLYLLDELDLSRTTGPVEINECYIFVAQSEDNMKGVRAYQIQEDGSFLQTGSLFESFEIAQILTNGMDVVGKSDQGIHLSQGLLEWPQHKQSGNFFLNLENFDTSPDGFAISTGNYGVEWIKRPKENLLPSRLPNPNPYNFTPPPEGSLVSQVLVPYYNPTTNEYWVANSAGWTAPSGWIRGTKNEDEPQNDVANRRSQVSNNWQVLAPERIRLFAVEKPPVFFDSNVTRAWKYRPNTPIDKDVKLVDGRWKNQSWFGSFYDISFPWIYHAKLKWIYFSESADASFWLWTSKLGWIWSHAENFPYFFSTENKGWIFIDMNQDILRYYNFSNRTWFAYD
jgi:hypothetical protein